MILGQSQQRMKLGTGRTLDAMRRPGPSAFVKADMPWWVPIARSDQSCAAALGRFDPAIQDRHHPIALGNGQRTSRAEIILHVDEQQGIVRSERGEGHRELTL